MFIAIFLNFVISFCFTLGLTQLGGTLLALATYKENKDYIPKWYILLGYNTIAAFAIAVSYTILVNYAPIVYKQVGLNDGQINLYSEAHNFMHPVVIKIENERVRYSLCEKDYNIENNMYEFYNSLNGALSECSLPDFTEVSVSIIQNPFKEVERRTTNSLIRRHIID